MQNLALDLLRCVEVLTASRTLRPSAMFLSYLNEEVAQGLGNHWEHPERTMASSNLSHPRHMGVEMSNELMNDSTFWAKRGHLAAWFASVFPISPSHW